MASQNYLIDPKNPFFVLEDDVDYETFFNSDLEQKHQQLIQRRKEIEERMIQSSDWSISLLRDSEQIGAATAEGLIRQREQLERTEKRLDEINSTLRFSQKHIQGIKSVFGSLQNYLSGQSLNAPISSTQLSESASSGSVTSPVLSNSLDKIQSNMMNTHPALKLRTLLDDEDDGGLEQNHSMAGNVTRILEKNLDEMSGSLARLKSLAIGLSEEVASQNDLINNLTDKGENSEIMIRRQNKDLTYLLRK